MTVWPDLTLRSLSSMLELELDREGASWTLMGAVPAMSGALYEIMLVVEIRASGLEMLLRRTGLPARWLAARLR